MCKRYKRRNNTMYINMYEIPNKYYVMKALKPDYLILCTYKKNKLGLTSYGVDGLLLKYICENCFDELNTDRRKLYEKLKELNINFLIIDGIREEFVHKYEVNNYGSYLYTAILNYIISE